MGIFTSSLFVGNADPGLMCTLLTPLSSCWDSILRSVTALWRHKLDQLKRTIKFTSDLWTQPSKPYYILCCQCDFCNHGDLAALNYTLWKPTIMKTSVVNKRSLTNYWSKQAGHNYRRNKFVQSFLILAIEHYLPICKNLLGSLVREVAL